MPTQTWLRPFVYGLACLLLAQLTAGCSSGSAPENPRRIALAPTPNNIHGHYRGVVTISGEKFHSEMILTADGEYRIYVGGPVAADSGPLSGAGVTDDLLHPESSAQIFGKLPSGQNEWLGGGIIVGQICSSQAPGRFCGQNTEVEIEITRVPGRHWTGEIRIPTAAGDEIWTLDVGLWSGYYYLSATTASPAGTYMEQLAPFAQGDDVIVTVDTAGGLFFQDPGSGCTGNGTLTPHDTGRYYVFDVALSIGNCNADYAYLNSDAYVGLATETQNNYWGYDSWLLLIVADPGSESPAAITMYANRY